jgi:hypothetical protein
MPPKASLETRKKIYRSLCYVLSDRASQVAWDEYTPADWDLFAQMADREGVAPLMYWKLKDSPIEVAPSTFNFLRSSYYQTLAQNTLVYQELERILEALDEAGIPVIVLKGAALATTVYEDIGLRPMGDLDLLVRPEHLKAATSVITSFGYFVQKAIYHIVFGRDQTQSTNIELHWFLIGIDQYRSTRIDYWNQARFWYQYSAKSISINRKNIHLFSPLFNIIYLTAHLGIQHPQDSPRLIWLYDLHLIIWKHQSDSDWEDVSQLIELVDCSALLPEVIKEARNRFDTPMPASLFHALAEMSENPVRTLKRPYEDHKLPQWVWNSWRFLNWQMRLAMVWRLIFPDRSYMRWRYDFAQAWMLPLSYPYRWFAILRNVLLTWLNPIRKRSAIYRKLP